MKNILLITTTFCLPVIFMPAQSRLVTGEYQDFYNWFHTRSQVTEFYRNNATLHIFGDAVKVHTQPKTGSTTVATLGSGHAVINIAYPPEGRIPEGEIKGYPDIWYHIKGVTPEGKSFSGYVFGIYIAKGWRKADLDNDGQQEFIMLGVSSQTRKAPSDLNAEIKILKDGRQLLQTTIPGLCIFEGCDASPLLRVIKNQPLKGHYIIEASAMTIGCMAGIDRAFLYWDGQNLERVYHAEFTTQHVWTNRVFNVKNADTNNIWNCSFQGIDANNNPVWECRAPHSVTAQSATVRAR